ncbi:MULTISPECIES: antitoxin Xre-like helix-turn-helix domain-containing protein [Morganellaceae]|uniref:Antitoxin Xre-like helix-turn-helix domain-containing protein n=1 Tax=Proteus genomosp. 6 TaxID=1311820 RepID=A0ABV1LE04_9GAMM|nr:antitoxin Xre-like helix-turn-helix domain-containing protein [Providencia rettgeri]
MQFDKSIITKELLIGLRDSLGYNNAQMADLLGISEKTWKNKISDGNSGKLNKLEYEFLLMLVDKHPDYVVKKR